MYQTKNACHLDVKFNMAASKDHSIGGAQRGVSVSDHEAQMVFYAASVLFFGQGRKDEN